MQDLNFAALLFRVNSPFRCILCIFHFVKSQNSSTWKQIPVVSKFLLEYQFMNHIRCWKGINFHSFSSPNKRTNNWNERRTVCWKQTVSRASSSADSDETKVEQQQQQKIASIKKVCKKNVDNEFRFGYLIEFHSWIFDHNMAVTFVDLLLLSNSWRQNKSTIWKMSEKLFWYSLNVSLLPNPLTAFNLTIFFLMFFLLLHRLLAW